MINGASFIVAGRIMQVALSLASVRVMTTMLSTGEVGNYYLIFTMVSFFSLAFLNPVGVYLNRKTHAWADEQTLYSRLFAYNCYLTAVCLLALPVVYVFCTYVGIGAGMPTGRLMFFVMAGLFCTTWNQVLVPMLNMLQLQRGFVLFATLTLAVGLLLSITCVKWFAAPTAITWLAGQATAQALVTGASFIYFRRAVAGRLDMEDVRATLNRADFMEIFRFVLPLGLIALMMWLQNQSYRMIVEQRAGLEFLGMIALGLGIASNVAAAVESLVQQLYLPLFYREINNAGQEVRTIAWNRMAQLTLPVFISLTIFVSCLSPFLVDFLAHGKFAGAWVYVSFGAWIELCRMTTSVLAGVAHAEMQTRHLVKAYLVGGLLSVAGVWMACGLQNARVLIPLALLLSGVAATGTMYSDMKRLMQTKLGIRTIRRATLLSSPFLLALPIAGRPHGLLLSLLVLSVAGGYFLWVQYWLSRVCKQETAA